MRRLALSVDHASIKFGIETDPSRSTCRSSEDHLVFAICIVRFQLVYCNTLLYEIFAKKLAEITKFSRALVVTLKVATSSTQQTHNDVTGIISKSRHGNVAAILTTNKFIAEKRESREIMEGRKE